MAPTITAQIPMMTSNGHAASMIGGSGKHSIAGLFGDIGSHGFAGRARGSNFSSRGDGSSHSGGAADRENPGERGPGFPGSHGARDGARGHSGGQDPELVEMMTVEIT